jgi:hypothetical protein
MLHHRSRFTAIVAALALVLAAAVLPARAADPPAAAAVPWQDPAGGWVEEYLVHYTGPYTGTAADPGNQPVEGALAAARAWAQQQGLGLRWYCAQSGPAQPSALEATDPRELGVEIIRNNATQAVGSNGVVNWVIDSMGRPLEQGQAYVTELRFVLPQGDSASRDSLRAALAEAAGASAEGAWPLNGYMTSRHPEMKLPAQVTISGKTYNWPQDFTADERRALLGRVAQLWIGRDKTPWYGDVYTLNPPNAALAGLGLGPVIRERFRADAPVALDSPYPVSLSDFALPSWGAEARVSVELQEAGLAFDPVQLLQDERQAAYTRAMRPYGPADVKSSHGYRAVVDLLPRSRWAAVPEDGLGAAVGAGDQAAARQQAQRLDAVVAAWARTYPELAPGGVCAGSVHSGVVERGGVPVQWQATLWRDEAPLASSLLAALEQSGAVLSVYAPVKPTEQEAPRAAQTMLAYQDQRYPWQVSYNLLTDDPHGGDSELAAQRLGKAGLEQLVARRDQLEGAFRAWLSGQGLDAAAVRQAIKERFSGAADQYGVVNYVSLAVPDEATGRALAAALQADGLPAPQVFRRYGGYNPPGPTLRWQFIPAHAFYGLQPEEAPAKLDPALVEQAAQSTAALKAALQQWEAEHGNSAGGQPATVWERKFGPVVRGLAVMLPQLAAADEDSLEAALRAALPGQPAPQVTPPPAPADTAAVAGPDLFKDDLLDQWLVPQERLSAFSADELPQVFTPDEIKQNAERAAQAEAAVTEWNARQAPADRVTVERVTDGGLITELRLHGGSPTIARELSLGQALELPGLPPYQYGIAFLNRHWLDYAHQTKPQAAKAVASPVVYETVPLVYWLYGDWEQREQRLARYYTPAQLERLRSIGGDFRRAVVQWTARQPDLRLVEQGWPDGNIDGTVRINQADAGSIALTLQVTVALADDARRAAALKDLEDYLAQAVPGLPAPQTNGWTTLSP